MRSGKRALKRRRAYTTGQVAEATGFANRTVQHLFDKGKLKGYRIPGGNDRRIPHDELLRFLRENAMPVPPELDTPRVLLVAAVFGLAPLLEGRGLASVGAFTAFDAGRMAQAHKPCAALVCLSLLGRQTGMAVARALASSGVPCAALAAEDENQESGLLAGGFSAVLPWGASPERIAAALADIIGSDQESEA